MLINFCVCQLNMIYGNGILSCYSPTTSLVHLDRGLYWTEQAAALSGKTHREIFDRNLSKIYNRLYRNARAIEAQKA